MKSKKRNRLGKIVGGILLTLSIITVFFYRIRREVPVADTRVRPVKSIIVASKAKRPVLFFPGAVESYREVDLSFEVSGRLIAFPVKRGMIVAEGDVVARLDPATFENQVRNIKAEKDLASSTLARMERALAVNAVSQEEYARAAAAVQKADAQLAIYEKALADTVLKARFGGRVSETYVNQYDNLAAGHPVLKLQDTKQLALAVSIPETYVRWTNSEFLDNGTFEVMFEAWPDIRYPAMVKEYATMADPVTRTFRVRLRFEHNQDFLLLPGMTGSLRVEAPAHIYDGAPPLVPSDAIGFASDGSAFVWVLEPMPQSDLYVTRRQWVKPGRRSGTMIEADGIGTGARIATAGVAFLTEGRKVSLLEAAGEKTP